MPGNKAVSTCKMCILKWRYKKKYNRPDEQGLEKGFFCVLEWTSAEDEYQLSHVICPILHSQSSVFLTHTYTKTPFPGSAKATLTHIAYGGGADLGGRCLWEMF